MEFLKSTLTTAISRSTSTLTFPYTLQPQIDHSVSQIWTLQPGTSKSDSTPVSVFTHNLQIQSRFTPLARNAARKLRTIRHPGVLRVIEVIEDESRIVVITERVEPLDWAVKRRVLSEETLMWGIYAVSRTVGFINDEAKSIHGNLRLGSVFVSGSGEWKVGGFEVLTSWADDDGAIWKYGDQVPDAGRYAPPEIATGNGWPMIKKAPLHAADSFMLGEFVFEVFNGGFSGQEGLSQGKNVPRALMQMYRRLVGREARGRISAAMFAEQGRRSGGCFDTALIRITEGADNLGLKSEGERDEWLKQLDVLPDGFPEDFFKMKILPELLKSMEFGGGGPKVFAAVVKIAGKMNDEEFESRVLPVVLRLFASPDRQMRVCLLDNLPALIDRIPQKDVNGKMFPMLVTGFSDTAPVVREQTIKSVLTIVGKLSDRTINGELLRYLAKTANDEQPGIRTNTTICLGKIARNLGVGSRSKVLIAAFSRALRDPFVHARNAALMAFSATADIYGEEDCATKILPALCFSLVDKEKFVRDSANKTLDVYLARVRNYASTLPETAMAPDPGTTANGSATTNGARMGGQADAAAGWAGWAISSFTNKLSAAKGDMTTTGPPTNGVSVTQSQPTSGRSTPAIRVSDERPTSKPIGARPVQTTIDPSSDLLEPEVEDEGFDAWGEVDEEGDNFFDASDANKILNRETKSPSNPFDDGGEPDFAGWLAAQNKPKIKPPLPKGLSKVSSTASTSTSRPTPNLGSRPNVPRSVSQGTPSTRSEVKVVTATVKNPSVPSIKAAPISKIDLKPKTLDNAEDDWGAWD